MLAFHGKQEIKDQYLERVRAHAVADELVKGRYWQDGRGCAVGCTVHSGDHGVYETELGIPRVLARLEDVIFEALPLYLAKTWPERFLKATPVGADLSKVWPKFAIWLLTDKDFGVIRFAEPKTRDTIITVSNFYIRGLKGPAGPDTVEQDLVYISAYADVALANADAANDDAANAALYAYAYANANADAAYAAAASAHAAADSAYAASAVVYAASANAGIVVRIAQSEKLLSLLSETGE